MPIDDSGKWWKGSDAEDIKGFLAAYSADSYKTHDFRLSRCSCGSTAFNLEASDDDGVAKRKCTKCKADHFILDSEEFWEDAEPEKWKCIECKGKETNVGVGFSLYEDGEIKWVYIGCRCTKCHILGCFAGWKIGYSPSRQLLEKA
jgi:hypothetical protein